MPETTCTECGKPFNVQPKFERQEKDGKPDGELVYFACPHCKHVWNAARITQRGIGVRARLNEAQQRQRARPSDANAAAVVKLEREMQAETKRLSGAGVLTP